MTPTAMWRSGTRCAVAIVLLVSTRAVSLVVAGPAGAEAPPPVAADAPRQEPQPGVAAARSLTIVTLGDSITRGVRGGVTAEQTFAALIESRLSSGGEAVRVVNVGIGGERTDQALQRLDRVLDQQPDVVTIMYGTNDSYVDVGATGSRLAVERYSENLIRLAIALVSRGIEPVLMTPPRWADDAAPDGQGDNPNARLEPYIAACREVARLWRLPLVDHYAHWTEARRRGTDLRTWTTDGCHPNPAGHEVLARTMLPGVQEAIGPRLRVRRKLSAARPTRVVCLGDSVTGIYYHTGSRRAYGDMLGIALERIAPGLEATVINAGRSGDTAGGGLARLDRDVLVHDPDLVTVMFGLNDMTRVPLDDYRRDLREIVARCRARGAEVVLATPNNVTDTERRPSATLVGYCDVVRAVGREEDLPVCDVYRELEAVRADDPSAWRLLFSDEIHPNMDGHKRVAAALVRTITGRRLDLADERPARAPLGQVVAALNAGRPVRLLAMPPLDGWVNGLLKEVFPTAEFTIETWPVASLSLSEIEQDAKRRVRSLKPDGVLIAIPRSVAGRAAAPASEAGVPAPASEAGVPAPASEAGVPAPAAGVPADESPAPEAWVRSYAWIMNWSLNFGAPTWDVVVVHPDVWEPLREPGPHDGLIRRLVHAQDLPLVDRPPGDTAAPLDLLRRGLGLEGNGPRNGDED